MNPEGSDSFAFCVSSFLALISASLDTEQIYCVKYLRLNVQLRQIITNSTDYYRTPGDLNRVSFFSLLFKKSCLPQMLASLPQSTGLSRLPVIVCVYVFEKKRGRDRGMVNALNKMEIPADCFVVPQRSVLIGWVLWRGPSHWGRQHTERWFDLSCGSSVFDQKSGAPCTPRLQHYKAGSRWYEY